MKIVKLTLPNKEEKEYSDFDEYLKDFNQCLDQIRWGWNKLTDDELELAKMDLEVIEIVLKNRMKNKFNAPNLEEWEKNQKQLHKIAARYTEASPLATEWINAIYKCYISQNKKENNRGRLWFRIMLSEIYDKESVSINLENWDKKTLHSHFEIMDVVKKLDSTEKLEKIVKKIS